MKSGNRKSVRLSGHDYSGPATYFITLCTESRECLFGQVINGEMNLNESGRIVQEAWMRSPQIRSELDLDRWIVMPDHFHGIVSIRPRCPFTAVVGATGGRPATAITSGRPALQSGSLGSFIGGFKSITTKRINEIRATPDAPVWQRNYDEHIIDTDEELERMRQYIKDNPRKWSQ
jgi:REP element-mobilizing transposase RayT